MRNKHDTSRQYSPCTVEENLEFYFQACSMTLDVRSAGVLAASLAAGGVNPFTGKRAFEHRHVNSAVQLMLSCGMYGGSGAWACTVGLPAKSGVAGCILLVVPNVMGMAVFSPPLDKKGNSVRGVKLIESIAEQYNLNIFSQLYLGVHKDIETSRTCTREPPPR
jgi:glutaminase